MFKSKKSDKEESSSKPSTFLLLRRNSLVLGIKKDKKKRNDAIVNEGGIRRPTSDNVIPTLKPSSPTKGLQERLGKHRMNQENNNNFSIPTITTQSASPVDSLPNSSRTTSSTSSITDDTSTAGISSSSDPMVIEPYKLEPERSSSPNSSPKQRLLKVSSNLSLPISTPVPASTRATTAIEHPLKHRSAPCLRCPPTKAHTTGSIMDLVEAAHRKNGVVGRARSPSTPDGTLYRSATDSEHRAIRNHFKQMPLPPISYITRTAKGTIKIGISISNAGVLGKSIELKPRSSSGGAFILPEMDESNAGNPSALGLELHVAFGIQRGACNPPCKCMRYEPQVQDGVCSCAHWPARHINMGKKPVKIGDLILSKDSTLQELMEPDFKLLSAVCSRTQFEHLEKLSSWLVVLFDAYDRSADLIRFAVTREIQTTKDEKQLFREDRLTFRIISQFMKSVGSEWIKAILGPIISDMCQKQCSYEVNPARLASPKDRKTNLKRLRKTVQTFLDSILKAGDSCPVKLRLLCNLVKNELRKVFPGVEVTGLGAIIFLRLICPALCTPHKLGIIDELQRGLVLVAKVLTSLSNNTHMTEEYMEDMNDFIEENYPEMKNFLLSLASEIKSPNSTHETRGTTKQVKEDTEEQVYQFIKKNADLMNITL